MTEVRTKKRWVCPTIGCESDLDTTLSVEDGQGELTLTQCVGCSALFADRDSAINAGRVAKKLIEVLSNNST